MRAVIRLLPYARNVNIRKMASYSGPGYQYSRSPHLNTIINIVPQQEAWVVERFGKFHKVLSPGLQILFPIVDQIQYVHSLKEVAVNIAEQTAITKDNVTLTIDGVLFYQVVDPYKNHDYAIKQLAQTTMRSEIGKLALDEVFKERDTLNHKIVESIRMASVKWGIECMRYEIRDVKPPVRVLDAMQMQVEAERKKRAAVLESEGLRESAINKATGEAQALKINADSRAIAIKMVSEAMSHENSKFAVSYSLAQQYIEAFEKIAKETNTVILPKNIGDVGSCITEAVAIYQALSKKPSGSDGGNSSGSLKSDKSEVKSIRKRDLLDGLQIKPTETSSLQTFPSTWKSKLI